MPLVGFAFLAWYGYAAKGILAKQGISYEGDNIEQSKPEFDFAKKK